MLAVLGAAGPASAAELLGPPGPVSPDGFWVGLRGGDAAALEAAGADVAAAGPGLWRVVPRAAGGSVTVRARAAGQTLERSFPVGPPAASVTLALSPRAPVKGQDTRAELTVTVLDRDGKPSASLAPPVVRANVGAVEALERVGPGTYRARYLLPATRYPEVAVLVAFAAWPHPQSVHGAFGALRVPLASAVELPGKTEPNAEMSLTIAGRKFGPVQTGADGSFKIPVVVPPGFGTASGTAVDRLRNRRTTPIDLMLPPVDQLACVVNPTRLPADGRAKARVLCATSDPFGNVAAGAKVQLAASRGALSAPRGLPGGVVEWALTAPDGLQEPVALVATWRQGQVHAREELAVELVQGPAARLSVAPDDALVHLGFGTGVRFEVQDLLGRPRAGAPPALVSGRGGLLRLAEEAPGRWSARYQAPPDGAEGTEPLAFRALGPHGAEPAVLRTWAEGGALWAAVTDLAGLPVPDQELRVQGRSVRTGADGAAAVAPLAEGAVELRHALWPSLAETVHVRDAGRWLLPPPEKPPAGEATVALELGPPVPVNVRLRQAGRRVTWWVEAPSGEALRGRRVQVTLSGARAGPSQEDDGRATFELQEVRAGASVTVVDVETGVAGLLELSP